MTDKYKQMPTDGRVKRFEFLMLDDHKDSFAYEGPEYIPTQIVTLHAINSLLTDLPSFYGVVEIRGESEVMMKNVKGWPHLFVRWFNYGHDFVDLTTPITGEGHEVSRLRKALEEANTLPEGVFGEVLETGDLLLDSSVYVLGGCEDCYLSDLLENVKFGQLEGELYDLVQGHIDYLLKDEDTSPILQIQARAKLMGRAKSAAYEFLEVLKEVAKREYEGGE